MNIQPIVFFMKIKFFSKVTLLKVTQFLSLSKVSLLKFFIKRSESVNFDANNDLQEDLKICKTDTFENYKSFVPVEVQSLNFIFSQTKTFLQL